MSQTRKRLTSRVSIANKDTAIYICPQDKQAEIHTLVVCNRGAGTSLFRLAHKKTTDQDSNYIYYDLDIDGGNTFIAEIPIYMNSGESIVFYASTNDLSINLYGAE